jgi:adenylate cyclase
VQDADGNVIFRGLSVRMGIHWGTPVCEVDPVTKRMDYFGPMVNRASRISSVADGGQITVSADFIAEIQRLLETHEEGDRNGSTGSEEGLSDDMMSQNIRHELRSLSSQGFEVKDLGERRLKGLENPEYIYLMYPHALASRLAVQRQLEAEQPQPMGAPNGAPKIRNVDLSIDPQHVWDLWSVSLRLEMLCSTLENPGSVELKAPETALLERMKNRDDDGLTDRFLLNFVEHQISRIEVCHLSLLFVNLGVAYLITRHVPRHSHSVTWSDPLDPSRKASKAAPCPTSSAKSKLKCRSCSNSKPTLFAHRDSK